MSRYGSVTLSGPTSLLTRIVQSSDPDDLTARVTAALAALPSGYTVVALTLAGAGDGATFTVTIEAGADADVSGGFSSLPTVTCFLASDAEALLVAAGLAGSGTFADLQVAGASKGNPFMGMRVKGTVVDGGGGSIPPLSDLWFVDVNTTVPAEDQTGSIAAPYSTLQIAFDAGHFRIFLLGEDSGAVVPDGVNFVLLTSVDPSAVADSLQIPDSCFLLVNLVAIGTLTVGTNCQVITNKGVGTATFGDFCLFCPSGPGAVSFGGSGIDQASYNDVTMGINSTFNATNAVLNLGGMITAGSVGLFGCQCRGSIAADSLDIQNCALTAGEYSALQTTSLQDVKCDAGVAFDNAAGQAFNLDGVSNYWIKTNGVTLTNSGEKVITDDLTP